MFDLIELQRHYEIKEFLDYKVLILGVSIKFVTLHSGTCLLMSQIVGSASANRKLSFSTRLRMCAKTADSSQPYAVRKALPAKDHDLCQRSTICYDPCTLKNQSCPPHGRLQA